MFHQTCKVSCLLLRNSLCGSHYFIKRNASLADGKMMNKIMGLNGKSKKVWYKSNVGANPTFEELLKQTTKNNAGRQATKRVHVLNKLIMKNITDLMATGENSDQLIGYGLEISKVSVSGDYRTVNVFWMARKSENDYELEQLLSSLSGPLKHELSRLRIMGEVPKIHFIKDKTYANIAAVDRLLNKADFGEDFIPTCSTLLKNHPTMFTTLDPEIKEKIIELDKQENLDNKEVIIPEMKMDVMGLDHSAITARLIGAVQKSKAVHRQINTVQNVVNNTMAEDIEKPQYLSFNDFIKKRKIQEAKALGRQKSRSIEKEMYFETIESSNVHDEEEDNNIDEFPHKI